MVASHGRCGCCRLLLPSAGLDAKRQVTTSGQSGGFVASAPFPELPGSEGEHGRGRRHVPGLRPPDHVGPQPPVRIPVRGIHPGPGIVPDPQIPQRHGHPGDLESVVAP